MSRGVLIGLDWFFLVFHTVLLVFNMVGWMWPRWRKLNLMTLLATAVSWTVMGIWYGAGYCVCTDLHWQVRRALGFHDEASTYVQFLVQRLTGVIPAPGPTKWVSGVAFVAVLVLSIWLNLRSEERRVGKEC